MIYVLYFEIFGRHGYLFVHFLFFLTFFAAFFHHAQKGMIFPSFIFGAYTFLFFSLFCIAHAFLQI
jgi:hypothetical protein